MKSHASMNRIYRLVWNAALNLWVAVAENAKGRGKSGSARNKAALLMLVPLAALMHGAQAADAANATVSAGAAGVATVGNTTTIHQSSQNVAIDWTSLSTRANEALIFNQPNASAIALNRITGSSPSELLGSLTANGQVFILNPNGVLFGAGSQVNVGGLVASTLSMSNADFMNGKHVFTGTGASGSVVNQGTLNAAPGGYLALLTPEVRNEGVMTASLGTALLAAGNKVTLNLDNGSLLGYSIDQGAINALAENKQLIQANGGQVLLSARAMDSLTTATVNNTGIIEAKTVQNKAGRILLMGDMETGTVNVGGTLDASASNGGDGGFIETSAAHVKVADGAKVTTLAAQGLTGNWLIDPADFTIASGSGSQTTSGIGATTLSSNLDNTSVTLSTDNSSGTGNGDIHVNAAISWSANTVLTLNAYRNINVNAAITATGASAGLVLNHGNYATTGFATGGTDYKVSAPITLSGGSATLAINGNSYTLIHSMAELDAIDSTGLSGRYALAGDLDASGTTYTDALVGSNSNRFNGSFAGLGHTISNLTINASGRDYVGLFGYAYTDSVIRDVGLVGGSVLGNNYVGGLAGYAYGTISNVYATGSVSGNNEVGGLVGVNFSNLSNAYTTGHVSSIASGNYSYMGGLIGRNYADISNVYATGGVSGNYYVGGLVGRNNVGISNAYASGSVSGVFNVGGLVGASAGNISNAYATGSVSAGTSVGGLVGSNSGSVNSSYWNTETSGQSSSAGGTGLTSAQMMQAGSFSGWNIAASGGGTSVWRIYEGYTAPLLRSFMTGLALANTTLTYNGGTQLGATTASAGVLGTGASGRNAGTYASGYYSGQQGYDISGGALTIDKANLVLSTSDVTKTYDGGTSATGTAIATSGTALQGSDTINGGTFAFVGKNAGTGKTVSAGGVTVNDGNSGNNYNVSYVNNTASIINQAALTISGITARDKIYNANNAASVSTAGAAYSGLVAGDVVTVSATGLFSDKNAGTGKTVNLSSNYSGADVGNYAITGQASTTASISQAALTISGITAGNKTYNASDVASVSMAGAAYNGLLAGDVVSVAATGLFSDKNAGANKTVNLSSSYSGADVGNYAITGQATTTASVSQAALTVSGITASDKTYNASNTATVSTAGASYSGLLAGDAVTVSATGLFSDKNVGANKTVSLSSSYTGADVGNYAITGQANTTASISQAALTISGITAGDKTYNTSTAATVNTVGASYSGLFAGDAVSVAATGLFSDKNAGANKTVNLNSSYSGTDVGNYAITGQASTTASISQATLTISGITAGDKTYNASDAATVSTASASYNGLFAGDVVSVAATGLFNDKNAGTNKTVNLSSSYSGADTGNYAITGQATTTASISQASLTVSGITAGDKTYDAGTSATVNTAGASYNGLFARDVVNVAATGLFGDKNAGAGKTVNLNSSYSGADAGNYAITSRASTTATINKADLTVQATGTNKVYDGTTAANVAFSANGLAGDVLNLTGNASFADRNAGLNKAVSVTGIAVGGADAGNYNLISGGTASTSADITPKALTVTANNDTRLPGGAAYSGGNGVGYSGFVAGETASVLGGSLLYGGSSQGASGMGTYSITAGGLNASNYTLAFVGGVLTIQAADAAVAALGGPALVNAYDAAKNTAGDLSGFSLSSGTGGASDDAAISLLNAAAVDSDGK
jgi:filamentous hemagglutinin family protein